jgi:CheY-like chemotaxis protein
VGERHSALVMVADDDSGFRAEVCGFLVETGFRVTEAADGTEAVALAGALAPDVVIMDLRMPGMDGIEATRRIKEVAPSVQVVMLTAYDDSMFKQEAAEAGAYCYLIKGSPPQVVLDVVKFAWGYKLGLEGQPVIPGLTQAGQERPPPDVTRN